MKVLYFNGRPLVEILSADFVARIEVRDDVPPSNNVPTNIPTNIPQNIPAQNVPYTMPVQNVPAQIQTPMRPGNGWVTVRETGCIDARWVGRNEFVVYSHKKMKWLTNLHCLGVENGNLVFGYPDYVQNGVVVKQGFKHPSATVDNVFIKIS